jgi:hypothetical protein
MEFHQLKEQYSLKKHDSDKAVVFSGKANGYYTVIEFEEFAGQNSFVLKVGARLTEEEMESDPFRSFTEEIKERLRPQMIEYRRKIFAVGAMLNASFEEIEKEVIDLLEFITDKFKSFNVRTGDFFHGDDDGTIELYVIADSYFLLSKGSAEERKKENAEAANRTGIRSAFNGAWIGAIISILLCSYFYSFSLAFYQRNFGWLMGLLIAIFAYASHRKKKEPVTKKSVGSVLGLILVLLAFSILSVIVLDIMTMNYSFRLAFNSVLFNPYFRELYSDTPIYFLFGAIVAAIYAFLYYRRHRALSEEVRVIEKVS